MEVNTDSNSFRTEDPPHIKMSNHESISSIIAHKVIQSKGQDNENDS